MTPLLALQLAMIATALFVAPFHRFAAVYVGCYAGAVLVRDTGVPEMWVNFGWHAAALGLAAAYPVLRRGVCWVALYLFGPLLVIDWFRIMGWADEYHAWWAVWSIVMVQVTLLHLGVDSETRRRAFARFRRTHGGAFFRIGVA